MYLGGFPDSPVVKICTYNAQDTGLIPGQGTKIPHVALYSQNFKKHFSKCFFKHGFHIKFVKILTNEKNYQDSNQIALNSYFSFYII